MRWFYFCAVAIAGVACDSKAPLRFLNSPSRVKVYTEKAKTEESCESLIARLSKKELVGVLVSDTLQDLESEGFANIQVLGLPASQKVFVLLVISDPASDQTLYYGCAENVQVSRNASHDLSIILTPASGETHGDS